MARHRTASHKRTNGRTCRPLWIDIDRVPYLAANWSLGGFLLAETIPSLEVGDRVLTRLSLDPITESPFAYIFARVVRINASGTGFAFTEMPQLAFDLMERAIFARSPMEKRAGGAGKTRSK
ncbi:PilZ domain-containing protein [Nisaea nitritireducens]|uniref:PilZ domain-containing protein n=1 Tax=Nisaea nitritireducens TaxID=568392 RepID=UPI0018693794|nr:PilZ domain-containing protein [Nisaea nitritireducens]